MKYPSLFLSLLAFSSTSLTASQESTLLEKQVERKGEPCLVTIFVHGTLKPAQVSLSTLHKVMHHQNKIKNSLYSISLEYMRAKPYLFQHTATLGLGLEYINPAQGSCKTGAHTMRELFEMQYSFYKNVPKNRRYYTFGWSGLLSLKERYHDAKKFYQELEKEIALLRSRHLEPIIHIIGYSHGGNVALNLGRIKNENIVASTFSIDQLILLATPIQRETDHFISDTAFFKKVYLLYSTEDNVQAADLFSTQKELFTRPTFGGRSQFKLPSTLTQIRFRLTQKIARSSKIGTEDSSPEEILAEPGIRCTHMDPGHVEFWDFAWGTTWYRKNLPLYPLPVLAFIPAILSLTEKFAPDTPRLTFDYCPSVNGARIVPRRKHVIAVPVLTDTITHTMKKLVDRCIPEDFSFEEMRRQEQLSLKEAHERLKEDRTVSKQILRTTYLDLARKMWPHSFPQL